MDIAYGLLVTRRGTLAVYEAGLFRANVGTYAIGDVLSVRVSVAGRAEYTRNKDVLYTSNVLPRFPLFVDLSLFDVAAELSQLRLVSKQEAWCDGVTCPTPNACQVAGCNGWAFFAVEAYM